MPNKSSPHGGPINEGVISSATLRLQDLLRAFGAEAERVMPFNCAALAREARECADALDDDEAPEVLSENASYILEQLESQLGEIAAREGMWFGACEGDGACFGYWLNDDDDEG